MANHQIMDLAGYRMFMVKTMKEVKNDPEIVPEMRLTALNIMWHSLTEEEKQHWLSMANEKKQRSERLFAPRPPRRDYYQVREERRLADIVSDLAGIQSQKGNPDAKNKECVICMDAPRSVICLPCKHLGCCATCIGSIHKKECPICRAEIQSTVNLSDVHVV